MDLEKHLTDWLYNSVDQFNTLEVNGDARFVCEFLERAIPDLNEHQVSKQAFAAEVKNEMQSLWQRTIYKSDDEMHEILSTLSVEGWVKSLSVDWKQFDFNEKNDRELNELTRRVLKQELLRIGLIATGNFSVGQVVDLSKLTSEDVDGFEMLKSLVAVWFCLAQGDESCLGAAPPLSRHLH